MADETDTPIEFMLALHPSLCKQLGVDDELTLNVGRSVREQREAEGWEKGI